MIQKFLSKYGLSVHLALLAALPLALTPFLTAATLGSVILWLSVFAAVWLFSEPSLRRGEHISSSRVRLRREMLRDPMFWFMLVVMAYALVRWLNCGIEKVWDPEAAEWQILSPAWSGFPASTPSSGYLPWCVAVATAIVVLGLRNGLGASARVTFGVVGAFVAGLGGLVAASCACGEVKFFVEATKAGFDQPPFWASCFGVWLLIGIVSGTAAESSKWAFSRIPFIFGVAGNIAALLFFAPPLVAVAWLLLAVAALIFSLVYVSRNSSTGAVARSGVLAVFGMAIPVFMIMTFMPQSFADLKTMNLNPGVAIPEAYASMSEVLSRIAKSAWLSHPWLGVGEGAFQLQLPSLAEKADWAVLPLKPQFATNGVFMVLAERGVIGALLMVVGLGLMIAYYVLRLLGGRIRHRQLDEGGKFLFSVPPAAWALPFSMLPFATEMFFSPILNGPTFVLTAAVPLTLAASSFPKVKPTEGSDVKNSENSSHREK